MSLARSVSSTLVPRHSYSNSTNPFLFPIDTFSRYFAKPTYGMHPCFTSYRNTTINSRSHKDFYTTRVVASPAHTTQQRFAYNNPIPDTNAFNNLV